MAHDPAPSTKGPTKLVIRNVGLMLSGRLEEPILEADCLVADNGQITTWGREADVDTEGATTIIDANGCTLCPGLIDSHVHPVVGDYTPRQQQLNWIDSHPAWRRDHADLGGRGPHAGPPARHRRAEGDGDRLAALVRELPPLGRQGPRRCPDHRAWHGRGRLHAISPLPA